MPLTLDVLCRYAISRSFFAPTTLPRAIAKLGFVQADPIRAGERTTAVCAAHGIPCIGAGP